MYAISRARSFSTILKKSNNRCFSVTANPPKEPIVSASSIVDNQVPPPPTAPTPPPETAGAEKKPWNFLKYGLIASLSGGLAAAGYVTYAYSLDEVDKKTKAFRASANHAIQDDGTTLGEQVLKNYFMKLLFTLFTRLLLYLNNTRHTRKFQAMIHSAALTVPAKFLELYIDVRRSIEEQVRGFTEPSSDKLLPDLHPMEQHVFTLVLDLNETLIYSDWKRDRGWRTFKRPGVDAFLEHLAQFYEIVVYSDQLSMYVDPSVDRLDPKHCIRYRLSRAATKYQGQKHYRDLSMLNRDPSRILYVSGNALETCLQPENCVPIKQWKGEAEDTTLLDLIPFLEYVARNRPADIRPVLASYQGRDIAKEFIERSKEHQKRMQEQKQQGRFWRR